ncbi:MAG: Hint domain-containing protein, partial [Minisyncoccia bacterium]
MAWYDLFKLWSIAFTKDPLSKKSDTRGLEGLGVPQPDVPLDIRNQEGGSGPGGSGGTWMIRLQSNEMVDLTSTQNRVARYKEYDQLRNVAEIEMAMTVFADETCLAGDTPIATVFHGMVPIQWLAENRPGERFAVYCWDEEKHDYVIGWAYDARKTKTAKTITLRLDDGGHLTCTHDHRVLLKSGEWQAAGYLQPGDELMPFHRVQADQNLTKLKKNQFPRIYTNSKGWIHERQMVD